MLNFLPQNYYKRNLPHWQPYGAEYFVTIRLAGSLPQSVVVQLLEKQQIIGRSKDVSNDLTKKSRKIFQKYEYLLDSAAHGPTWLADPAIAHLIQEAIFHRDSKEYDLYAFCIMSNHVHIVFKLLLPENTNIKYPVTDIMSKFKSFTGLKSNQKLGRNGSFWHAESYDHVIRNDDELERIITYVINNPVKAGLIDKWQNWKFTYCKHLYL